MKCAFFSTTKRLKPKFFLLEFFSYSFCRWILTQYKIYWSCNA